MSSRDSGARRTEGNAQEEKEARVEPQRLHGKKKYTGKRNLHHSC